MSSTVLCRYRVTENETLTRGYMMIMKIKTTIFIVAIALISELCAGVPVPSFSYFGKIKDEYGNPYTAESDVNILCFVNGSEISRSSVKNYGAHVNFLISVVVENAESSYAAYAVSTDSVVEFFIENDDGEKIAAFSAEEIPRVGLSGQYASLDLTTGADENHNGISDIWEAQTSLTYWWLTGIYPDAITAGDDLDGDGASNYAEYVAGTSAADSADVFKITKMNKVASGTDSVLFSMQFYSANGRSYYVREQPDLSDDKTRRLARYSTSMDGPWTSSYLSGQGEWITIYIQTPDDSDSAFYSLEVQ